MVDSDKPKELHRNYNGCITTVNSKFAYEVTDFERIGWNDVTDKQDS